MSTWARREVISISLRRQVRAKTIAATIRARNWSWGYLWLRVALLPFPPSSSTTTWPSTTAPGGIRRGILEFKGSIDAACVLFIACRHLSAVLIHHVGLKIDTRTKYNEFVGLASRVGT